MIEVISLGAGVQSTTLALMAAHGEIGPMPTAAIFADTGGEPVAVYEHLRWLASPNVLPFPVRTTKWRDLREDILASARGEGVGTRTDGYVAPPFFTSGADEETEAKGILRRECTQNYKIDPIRHELKRLMGLDPKKPIRLKEGDEPLVRQWIGISLDEWTRMKPARERWISKYYPLVDRRMTRGHCYEWLERHEYPRPPRSACTFCPFRRNDEWRALRESPPDWADAIAIDEAIRDMPSRKIAGLQRGGELFVHQSLTPLAHVDLRDPHENQIDMWDAECEGMCGV